MNNPPDDLRSQLERYFQIKYGDVAGTVLVRAPGRVNLIGDHTDYNGLPVFPAAIRRHIMLLFRAREDDRVRIRNLDDEFPDRAFGADLWIPPAEGSDWSNYVRAGVQSVVRRTGEGGPVRGWEGVVGSNLPRASGLSSSSALVVASALATLSVNEAGMKPLELADLLARGEQYVGTQGGGMDQAICLGGRAGHAFRIDFGPLRMTPTRIPDDWVFLVAGSLAVKTADARSQYNVRARQCREALQRLAVEAALPGATAGYSTLLANNDAAVLLETAEHLLPDPLNRRFRHTVTEAGRVLAAERAMAAHDGEEFGRLMVASHESLRDDFGVSTEALDDLVRIALDAGADGARLTGAGFGGCAIALCRTTTVDAVREALRAKFYAPRGVPEPEPGDLFTAEAGDGARIE
ncbi:MAG: galactokinase [Gemmatimonadota bacterium]|jgi:galactokinase